MDKNKAMAKGDLTQGPIAKKLLMFALPIIAGNLVMQLYNVVDSIVVGNFVGSDALAAVGVSFPIMMLFNALFMGASMGANIVISQYKGAGDMEKLERALNTAMTISFILGVFITIFGVLLSRPLLELLGTPDNIIEDSTVYLMIIFGGTLGNMTFNIGNGIVRGMGDSKWPLYSLIISSLTNVVLDLLFVIQFNMGVAGVAWATLIAHIVAGGIMVWRQVAGKYGVRVTLHGMMKIDGSITKMIAKLGLPSAVQNVAMSLGNVIIQSLANNFGSDYIAANTIVMKADGFAMMPMMGLGMAITTFVGQNIGAGDRDRARKGVHAANFMCLIIGGVMGVLLWFFGIFIMRAFTDVEVVLHMGENGIKFLAFFYIFMGLNNTVGGAMRGAGAAMAPAIVSIVSTFVRIPIAYLIAVRPLHNAINAAVSAGQYATYDLAKAAGVGVLDHYMGLFYAMGISMVVSAALIYLYFHFGKWHEKGVTDRARQGAPTKG